MIGFRKRRNKINNEIQVNYNDRIDGYGVGPPEYMDDKRPYEKERKRIPVVSQDKYVLRNQYGPVDQYNFRNHYQRRWSSPLKSYEDKDDWREWDREKYSNDDYSCFAGPDYRGPEDNFAIGEEEKTLPAESMPNRDKYEKQSRFIRKGPKGYKRSDDRIYEDVCEALLRHPAIDATNIEVKVENGIVALAGKVDTRRQKRFSEEIIIDVPGVRGVRNGLIIETRPYKKNSYEDEYKYEDTGPDAPTRNDLGIGR